MFQVRVQNQDDSEKFTQFSQAHNCDWGAIEVETSEAFKFTQLLQASSLNWGIAEVERRVALERLEQVQVFGVNLFTSAKRHTDDRTASFTSFVTLHPSNSIFSIALDSPVASCAITTLAGIAAKMNNK
jgi:hypothetical protein